VAGGAGCGEGLWRAAQVVGRERRASLPIAGDTGPPVSPGSSPLLRRRLRGRVRRSPRLLRNRAGETAVSRREAFPPPRNAHSALRATVWERGLNRIGDLRSKEWAGHETRPQGGEPAHREENPPTGKGGTREGGSVPRYALQFGLNRIGDLRSLRVGGSGNPPTGSHPCRWFALEFLRPFRALFLGGRVIPGFRFAAPGANNLRPAGALRKGALCAAGWDWGFVACGSGGVGWSGNLHTGGGIALPGAHESEGTCTQGGESPWPAHMEVKEPAYRGGESPWPAHMEDASGVGGPRRRWVYVGLWCWGVAASGSRVRMRVRSRVRVRVRVRVRRLRGGGSCRRRRVFPDRLRGD